MTSASSTFPVVIKTVVAQLRAASGLTGVQILYGQTGDPEAKNVVFPGSVTWPDEKWAAMGGSRSREESYDIEGFVEARTMGETAEEALETCLGLAAVIETTVRGMAVPGMGFATALTAAFGSGKAQVTNFEFVPKSGTPFALADSGMGYQLVFDLRFTARI